MKGNIVPQKQRAEVLREQLAYLVEYLRFHTAEAGDWNRLLPELDEVLERCETTLSDCSERN